ncbi:hypothetical protein GOA67_10830 [Sinorhizobium meliloti]|nr:hypothetical protein [Sinorhizobium meliloti]
MQGELRTQVADGRVLNVARSVAVLTDVLVLRGSLNLLIGDLAFVRGDDKLGPDSLLTLACKDETKDIRLKRLRKVAFGYEKIGGVDYARVYFGQDEVGLTAKSCVLPDDLDVTFYQFTPPLHRRFKFDEIADITPRLFSAP